MNATPHPPVASALSGDGVDRAAVDDAHIALCAGVEVLGWIWSINHVIADLASQGREADHVDRLIQERRIQDLAKVVGYLAEDFSNTLDAAREGLSAK